MSTVSLSTTTPEFIEELTSKDVQTVVLASIFDDERDVDFVQLVAGRPEEHRGGEYRQRRRRGVVENRFVDQIAEAINHGDGFRGCHNAITTEVGERIVVA